MISVVICSIKAERFQAVKECYARVLTGEPFELIGIHDARSLSEGYNRGIARSRGDVVIFSHDDIEILAPNLTARLRGHLEKFDLVGVAGTDKLIKPLWHSAGPPHIFGQVGYPHQAGGFEVQIYGAPKRAVGGVQALDGVFLAARRSVLDAMRFDEETFQAFHLYDIDFSFRAHLQGFRLAVCNDLMLVHASTGDFGDEWAKHALLFYKKHEPHMWPGDVRKCQPTRVLVQTREEVAEVMTCGYWDD